MEYRSKYKAEEIEAILDAKNNTGEGVDSNLDVMFTGQLQTKEVEVSEDTTIKADEGYLGLKEVSVKVSGGGGSASSVEYIRFSGDYANANPSVIKLLAIEGGIDCEVYGQSTIVPPMMSYDFTTQFDMLKDFGSDLVLNHVDVKTDLSLVVYAGSIGERLSLNDYLIAKGVTQSEIDSWTRITEEEFYTL